MKRGNWKIKTKLFVISFISILLLISFSSILFHQNGNQFVTNDSNLNIIINDIFIVNPGNSTIRDQIYTEPVYISSNVTMINCSFQNGLTIQDNITGPSEVVITNCSIPGTGLTIGGNSTCIFANQSGGLNYINIYGNVLSYQNGTLIANRTIIKHYGLSPMFLGQNFGTIIFDNTTVDDFKHIAYDNGTMILRNNSVYDSGYELTTLWTNSSIILDNSTFRSDSLSLHNNCSAMITNNSYLRANSLLKLDGGAVLNAFNSYIDCYPAFIPIENFSTFTLYNSTIRCDVQAFELNQNSTLTLQDNSTFDQGAISLRDNGTINCIDSIMGNRYLSENIEIYTGFARINVQNSTLRKILSPEAVNCNPEIILNNSIYEAWFGDFRNYCENITVIIHNSRLTDETAQNQFGKNITLDILNSTITNLAIRDNATLKINNTVFTGDLDILNVQDPSYPISIIKNVSVENRFTYGKSHQENWENFNVTKFKSDSLDVLIDNFDIIPTNSNQTFTNVRIINSTAAEITLNGDIDNGTIKNIKQANATMKFPNAVGDGPQVYLMDSEIGYLVSSGDDNKIINISNCIIHEDATVSVSTDHYFTNCTINGGTLSGMFGNVLDFDNCTFTDEMNIGTGLSTSVASTFRNSTFESIVNINTFHYVAFMINSTFENVDFNDMVKVTGGNIALNNISFYQPAFLWVSPTASVNSTVFINNSSFTTIRAEGVSFIEGTDADIELLFLYEDANATLESVEIEQVNLEDNANFTLNGSVVQSFSFDNDYYWVNNSHVMSMAPELETPSLIYSPFQVLLNWSSDPGKNLSGSIKNYTIYRVVRNRGNTTTPLDNEFEVIQYIEYPDILIPSNVSYLDTNINDNTELWYKIAIIDEGNNYANSSVIYQQFVSGNTFAVGFSNPLLSDADTEKVIETGHINITFFITDSEESLKNITLHYRFSENDNWTLVQLAAVNKTISYLLGPFQNEVFIEFKITSFDIYDNFIVLLSSTKYLIYPAFPIVNLDPFILILVITGSGIVGAVIGITHLQSKKSGSTKSDEFLNKLKEKLKAEVKPTKKAHTESVSMPSKTSREFLLDPGTEVNTLSKFFTIGLIGLIVGVSSALGIGYLLNQWAIATLILMGMIFLALYVYVVWLYRDTTLDIREEKISVWRSFIGYMNAFIILAVTILMLQVGLNIPWIRYYIVEQSGTAPLALGPLILPYSYIKVASAALTSLVAFSLTCYLDIRKNLKDIEVYEKQNANISSIIYTKEEFIKKTNGRINIKVLIFLALLGFALIPYSADGFSNILPIGLLLVLPCVIVFAVFFLIGFIGKSNVVARPFLLESVKTCHNCNTQNMNSAVFCSNCKTRIISDQILIDETAECQTCSAIIAKGSKFCMSCGEVIKKLNTK